MRPLSVVVVTSAMSLLPASCAERSDLPVRNIPHYDIDLTLDPRTQFLNAEVNLTLPVPSDSLDRLTFYLHRQLLLRSVSGPELSGYQFDTLSAGPYGYMPDAGAAHVTFERPLKKDESIALRFEYEGTMTDWPEWSANVLTAEWTELGLYLPWFPYNYDDYGPFTFTLAVHVDSTYEVRSYGDHERDGDTWRFQWNRPAKDIVVVAAPDLKTLSVVGRGGSVNVHYVSVHDSTARRLAEDALLALSTYGEWFGGEQPPSLSLITSLRERGGGYARPGAVVLSNLHDHEFWEQPAAYLRFLSHEAAHLWWTGAAADSWEDWLNESFAEYSALLAVRERFGDEEFERRLELKREGMAGTPRVWEFERNDISIEEKARQVEKLLYDKGPVLLHELAQRIGEREFLLLCREMVRSKVTSTDSFLEVLQNRAGGEVRVWFEDLLKSL